MVLAIRIIMGAIIAWAILWLARVLLTVYRDRQRTMWMNECMGLIQQYGYRDSEEGRRVVTAVSAGDYEAAVAILKEGRNGNG